MRLKGATGVKGFASLSVFPGAGMSDPLGSFLIYSLLSLPGPTDKNQSSNEVLKGFMGH
jgi:hypothetical protein